MTFTVHSLQVKCNGSQVMLVLFFFVHQLEKLSWESVQNPTPLLKLLSTWAKNPRYFPMLAKRSRNKPDLTILSSVFTCLTAPAVTSSVVAIVMGMTKNLLSLEDYEPEDGVSSLLDDNSVLR